MSTMEHESSYEGLARIVRESDTIWHAADSYWMGEPLVGATVLEIPDEIVYFSPADLVVTAGGGVRLSSLQDFIRESRQWLPIATTPLSSPDPTLAEAIGLALPHTLESQYGIWREWILGMTVVLGDGTIAKSGCRAVKSVAGYDAHKLFVGARGTLGVIAEVTLRLYPLAPVPHADEMLERPEAPAWIHRVLRSEFQSARESAGNRCICEDAETGTIWGVGAPPNRNDEDWLIQSWPTPIIDPNPWVVRAKALLDPEGKMNPGQLEALP